MCNCKVVDEGRDTLLWSEHWVRGCIIKNKHSRLFSSSMDRWMRVGIGRSFGEENCSFGK